MAKKGRRERSSILSGRELRSWIMSRVPQRDTSPEMILRSGLHGLGFRFRVNNRGLPGSPDILLPKYRTAIFVHGCFWHRHGCRKTTTPKSNLAFWEEKFEANVRRDASVVVKLADLGWRVLTVWECALRTRDRAHREHVVAAAAQWLRGDERVATLPSPGVLITSPDAAP